MTRMMIMIKIMSNIEIRIKVIITRMIMIIIIMIIMKRKYDNGIDNNRETRQDIVWLPWFCARPPPILSPFGGIYQ